MQSLRFLILLFLPLVAHSQVLINSGTQISGTGSPDIIIQSSSNLSNGSTFDFSAAQLRLILIGTNQNVSGLWSPKGVRLGTSGNQTVGGDITTENLAVNGGGTKIINGVITVTNQIDFTDGILQPGTGKILFTGNADGIINASQSSYVNGLFFNKNSGLLTFPVGAPALGYAPAQLESGNENEEIGISVINENPNLSSNDAELVFIDNTHYWQLTTANLAAFTSRIILPFTTLSDSELNPVVVAADAPGGTAFNLGNFTSSETSVTSQNPVNRSIVTIGGSTTVDIKIHDLISPFKAGYNDYLYITNISNFPLNKVTLLDRYGVTVKEWTNFTNFDDPFSPNTDTFNFASLSPGNYICVVEYGKEGQAKRKKAQMITVLKVK